MKGFRWQILLGIALIALSTILYFIHYAIYRDARHIFLYLIGDIAFIPIQVLLVTLIIDQMLTMREKRSLLNKLNMVIGAFFSEVGTELLRHFSNFDRNSEKIRASLMVNNSWTDQEFSKVTKSLRVHDHDLVVQGDQFETLRGFFVMKRNFLLVLLENPNLLEHETFTELLWAVFHLTEELVQRRDVRELSEADSAHLIGDAKRAYALLISEWLAYMKHLRNNYPYLFSLAMRTNPFDPQATIEIG